MARVEVQCRASRCTSPATKHVEYRQGGTYVKSHFCPGHATSEAADFERTYGVMTSTSTMTDACYRGRC